jgi:NADH:ubiquinone oxidoreductase subunit E
MNIDLLSDLKSYSEKSGSLNSDVLIRIGKKYNKSIAEMYSIATFYSETSPAPRGKYKINFCKSLPCKMKKMEEILAVLLDELQVTPGGVTRDGAFSLHLVNCIGACDNAPAMLVNGKLYTDLSPSRIRKILNDLK